MRIQVFYHNIKKLNDHQQEEYPHQGRAYIFIYVVVKCAQQEVVHECEFALQDSEIVEKLKGFSRLLILIFYVLSKSGVGFYNLEFVICGLPFGFCPSGLYLHSKFTCGCS